MNEQQIAAVKQALEALEEVKAHRGPALWGGCFALEIAALRHILTQDALDKKAENARELGLDYEPARPSFAEWTDEYVRENLHKLKQQPADEPVAICPNCLGTKRPHADDPEWKGRCDCTRPASYDQGWKDDKELAGMNILEMIAEMRGGIPESCDFCGQPYNDKRQPTPDEGGEWACTECWERWDKEDQKNKEMK